MEQTEIKEKYQDAINDLDRNNIDTTTEDDELSKISKNVTVQPAEENSTLDERYAEHLKFLWEQYNKFMSLGFIASATTIAFLIQGVLFNKDTISIMEKYPLDTKWLVSAIISAGFAALLFITARWCSQILMERQIYGNYNNAVYYFKTTLNNETIWPTALEPKVYMNIIDRIQLLKIVGNLNEFAKWLGIILILFSWSSTFKFAYPLIEYLDPR